MNEMEAPQNETSLQMNSSARYSNIHRSKGWAKVRSWIYQTRREVSSSTYSTTSRPLHYGPPTPRRPRTRRPTFLASPGLMWIRQKTSKAQGKWSNMATDEKQLPSLLENKALNMDTSLEEKFGSSIISISRVSAGKMQILWGTTRQKTLWTTARLQHVCSLWTTLLVLWWCQWCSAQLLPQNFLSSLHAFFSRDKALQ